MEQAVQKTKAELIRDSLRSSMDYVDYRLMVSRLALEGKSTGSMESREYVDFTRLNDQRVKRLDKTI